MFHLHTNKIIHYSVQLNGQVEGCQPEAERLRVKSSF